jgi:CHASE3 domain sensor protein
MQRSVSSIRNLLAGFAGLLLLMGGLAVDATLQTWNVSAASTALRKESRDRDALLDQLRTDTHRSATLARDYILERDEVLAVKRETELQQLQANDARISPVYASLDTSQCPAQNSGPSGSLLLSREALSSSPLCRFIPAHTPHFFPATA